MVDFKKIETQEDLQELLEHTGFIDDDCFDGLEIDGNYPHISECSYMSSVTCIDTEVSGYDALFVETLVQWFKSGKIKVVNNS
jgi:hypothetical protein